VFFTPATPEQLSMATTGQSRSFIFLIYDNGVLSRPRAEPRQITRRKNQNKNDC
jgi:hypothetical protein